MKPYDHSKVEKKWQKIWDKKKIYQAKDNDERKKFYALIEFPYPSGDGLHVGHIKSNTAMDVISRKRRMEGQNVLYPIGWDAFGLPTENYAIKTGIQPEKVTKMNTDTFRRQLKALGFSFDWSREINTTDPNYYKWTQWIFLQLLKAGLAYKKKTEVNWCPKDLIVLANEEVVNGCCERCGTAVEKRDKEQWILAITKYADRLDRDLDTVNFLEKIKIQQRNWIGRSEGAEISFPIRDSAKSPIIVYTTRPDTLYGVTYIVLSPEHEWVSELLNNVKNKTEVEEYIKRAKAKTEIERTSAEKEKTGVELKGIKAVNPATKKEIPIYVADYVLAHYGTGAVMAVPAHDERDYQFARKFGLPIIEVLVPERIDKRNPPVARKKSVERTNVHAIVRNPKTGKMLCLKWKKHPWTTFPMGGVEKGESIIDAAKREVLEETGYKNLVNARILGGQVRAEYFAAHKDENRVSFTSAVLFDIANEERAEINIEESDAHDIVWTNEKDITAVSMTHAEMDIWLERIKLLDQKKINLLNTYTGEGVIINSDKFTGMQSQKAIKEITNAFGNAVVRFKLRDWIFSRQRYWGEPIPVIHCPKCGIVPVPEKDLPVKLPKVENYKPTETGESPLASIDKWVNTKCPQCKGPAKRETDTMPNWAGSSWYYLRYTDPKNKKALASRAKLEQWTPVDWYNGGMEHTTLHLLYSRFWHKFLFDIGVVPTSEPYMKRTSQGLILAKGGVKMSKSVGNVINPDEIVKTVGADTLRVYEMFMGPFDQAIAWDTENIAGSRRFLERVWKLAEKIEKKTGDQKNGTTNVNFEADKVIINDTIKKVTGDIESMRFNTAISSMMILLNHLEKQENISAKNYSILLKLLSPFAPHITEELWSSLPKEIIGKSESIHTSSWPSFDENIRHGGKVKIMVQINGKVRGNMEIEPGETDQNIENMALNMDEIKKWLSGKTPQKIIIVKNKVINIVI